MATLAELTRQRDALVARLEDGERKIAARERARGHAPHSWIDAWIALLGEYEQAEDAIRAHTTQAQGALAINGGRWA